MIRAILIALAALGAVLATAQWNGPHRGVGVTVGQHSWAYVPLPDIPDPAFTPGVVASTDEAEVCGREGGLTYSQRHRQTTSGTKKAVLQEYGQEPPFDGEIDHRLPLALGGADVVKNLWPQKAVGKWNYHMKDALEVYVWAAVCKHHTMTLADGQAVFLAPDWRAGYCKLIGGEACK